MEQDPDFITLSRQFKATAMELISVLEQVIYVTYSFHLSVTITYAIKPIMIVSSLVGSKLRLCFYVVILVIIHVPVLLVETKNWWKDKSSFGDASSSQIG